MNISFKKFVLCIILTCYSFICQAEDTIKVAMNPDFAPFQTKIDGKPAGIDVDIVNEIAKRMKLKPEFIMSPWARCLALIQDGEVDLLGYVGYKAERASFLDFLQPAYQGDVKVFYMRKGEKNKIKKAEDLQQLRIGLIRGTKHYDSFDNDSKIQKTEFNMFQQGFQMLESSRIDAIIGNDVELPIHLKNSNNIGKFEVSDYIVKMDRAGYFTLSKKSKFQSRKSEFEQILKSMVDSGEIDKLIKVGIKKYNQ